MEQTLFNQDKSIRCKNTVVILLVVSAFFYVISNVQYFVCYSNIINGYEITNTYRLEAQSIVNIIFYGLPSLALTIAPTVLLLLYVFRHNNSKSPKLVFLAFLAIAVSNIFSVVSSLISCLTYLRYSFASELIKTVLKPVPLNTVYSVTYILAAISARNGLNKKIFVIIPTVLSLIFSVISLFSLTDSINFYLETEQYLYAVIYPAGSIASITLNIALLIFGLENTIPPIAKAAKKQGVSDGSAVPTPEQELLVLNNKLNQGLVTEEEYQLQRTEIINKL